MASDILSHKVNAAMHLLSLVERSVVEKIVLGKMTQEQVASELHLSQRTVSRIYTEAINKLREYLE